MRQNLNHVVNHIRQNNPAIKVSPFDDEVSQLLDVEVSVGKEPWLLADGSFNTDFDPVAAGIDMTKKYTVGTDANKYEKAKRKHKSEQSKEKASKFFKKIKKGFEAFTEEAE